MVSQVIVREFIELSARNSFGAVCNNAQLLRNGTSGVDVVAGNHDNANTSAFSFFNSRFNFGTNGIYHARKSNKAHVMFERIGGICCRFGITPIAASRRNNTKRLIGKHFVIGNNLCANVIGERNDAAFRQIRSAARQNYVGRTLGMLHICRFIANNNRHHFTRRVERNLTCTRTRLR